jgi:hypothetical protein
MKRRRTFLTETGLGFTGLALNAMLQSEGVAHAATEGWRPPNGKPHFAPKAKRVIWLFMIGGASQMETFDPKPMLNKYAGKTVSETPFKDVENSPYVKKNLREVIAGLHTVHPTIYPMQIGFKKYGQSGLDVSDWFPHVGSHAEISWRWFGPCGPPITTTARSCSSTPGGTCWKGSSRPSARGCTTGWDR